MKNKIEKGFNKHPFKTYNSTGELSRKLVIFTLVWKNVSLPSSFSEVTGWLMLVIMLGDKNFQKLLLKIFIFLFCYRICHYVLKAKTNCHDLIITCLNQDVK